MDLELKRLLHKVGLNPGEERIEDVLRELKEKYPGLGVEFSLIEHDAAWARDWGNASGHIFINNSVYARLYYENRDTIAHTFIYAYTGYKVHSSKFVRATELIPTSRLARELNKAQRGNPREREPKVPPYLEPIADRFFVDEFGDDCFWLERDVALTKDEAGNVITRLDAWCKVEDFEKLFGDIIADPAKRPIMRFIKEKDADGKMGWLKYMEKFEGEGIEF